MATPIHEDIIRFKNRSFMIRRDKINYADETGYHVHPEMEIALLEGGGGVRTVNGITENFGERDLVLVPGDIPHCWEFSAGKCNSNGIVTDSSCQFPTSLLSGIAQVFPEFKEVLSFYTNLNHAIQITGKTAEQISGIFADIIHRSEFRQTLDMLSILTMICESGEYRMVGAPRRANTAESRADVRFHLVDKYVSDNYDKKITLKSVSEIVGMSPTAFCNAFKAMRGITFARYLTDYRMRIAASLIKSSDNTISEIGYRTGYGDVAHFTRAFKKHFGVSPTEFRRG